jgi:hypothetical protein
VLELTYQLGEVNMNLLEMKQKVFERTSGNLSPRLLQKMVGKPGSLSTTNYANRYEILDTEY